jgi:hypothetical protein
MRRLFPFSLLEARPMFMRFANWLGCTAFVVMMLALAACNSEQKAEPVVVAELSKGAKFGSTAGGDGDAVGDSVDL